MTNTLVTIFGGSGFVGRQVAQELLARGARVRIAVRKPELALRIKPLGGLGQTQLVAADIRKPISVAHAVAGADAVINLVGILSGDFSGVHAEGAANVAKAAADAKVGALVHMSAIGADASSRSAYGRSKAAGEEAVKAAYPKASIIRSSLIFGAEDQFTNRFAALIASAPVMPVVAGKTRFQPAFVTDVAKAIALAALEPARFGGKTFELGGPEVMSMTEIFEYLAKASGRTPSFAQVPDAIAGLMASLTGWLPGAPLTGEQWKMLQQDNVVASGAAGFADFGIKPSPLAAVADQWLVRYRKQGRFGGRAEA